MAGLPPFNGFLSKEMFLTAMLSIKEFGLFGFRHGGFYSLLLRGSRVSLHLFIAFTLSLKHLQANYKPNKLPKKPHEAPIGMLISPVF